jgi:hypothetical protein
MHERDAQAPARDTQPHRVVRFKAQLPARFHQLLDLPDDGGHLPQRALGSDEGRGMLHAVGTGSGSRRALEDSFQQSQIHRPGHIRTKQVVLRIADRRGNRSDLTAALAQALNDVGQVILTLGIVVRERFQVPEQRSRPNGVERTIAFRQIVQGLAHLVIRDRINVLLLGDAQDAAIGVTDDPAFPAIPGRFIDGRQERQVRLSDSAHVRLVDPPQNRSRHDTISHADDDDRIGSFQFDKAERFVDREGGATGWVGRKHVNVILAQSRHNLGVTVAHQANDRGRAEVLKCGDGMPRQRNAIDQLGALGFLSKSRSFASRQKDQHRPVGLDSLAGAFQGRRIDHLFFA